MAKQSLDLGTSANDGTGDSLRSGGTKINANFTELYTAIGGDANNLPANDKTVFHSSDTVVSLPSTSYTLSDGQYSGEIRVLINTSGGSVTVTPTNFGNGSQFVVQNNESCMLIWSGTTWFLIGNQSQVTIT